MSFKLENDKPSKRGLQDYDKKIANRIKKVLTKLIDSSQTGFIKGRYIGENIRILLAGRICNNFLVDCALFDKSMKLGTGVDL